MSEKGQNCFFDIFWVKKMNKITDECNKRLFQYNICQKESEQNCNYSFI